MDTMVKAWRPNSSVKTWKGMIQKNCFQIIFAFFYVTFGKYIFPLLHKYYLDLVLYLWGNSYLFRSNVENYSNFEVQCLKYEYSIMR